MKVNDTIQMCESYFSGFKDIREHKSFAETMIGIGKVLSYITGIVPLAMGIVYYQNRKIEKINQLMDHPEALKSDLIFQKTQNSEAPYLQKDKLVSYLVDLVSTKEVLDETDKKRFQNGFRLLDMEGQKAFFKKVEDPQLFKKAIELIPRDITVLHLFIGNRGGRGFLYTDTEMQEELSQENITFFLKHLQEFSNVNHIEIEMPALRPLINDVTLGMIQLNPDNPIELGPYQSDHLKKFQLIESIVGIVDLMKASPIPSSFKITYGFSHFMFERRGLGKNKLLCYYQTQGIRDFNFKDTTRINDILKAYVTQQLEIPVK